MSATIIDFATRLPQREHLPDDVDYSSPTFLCYLHAVNWKFRREGKRYPLYDDVARLRIVRAHLREVNPAMKSGNVDKARRSFDKFDAEWDNIEDLVKVRSREAYDTIEQQTDRVAGALKQPTPDVDRVTSLVSGIMDEYNKIVTQVTREARGR